MAPWLLGSLLGVLLAIPLWRLGSVTLGGAVAGAALTAVFYGLGGALALVGFGAFVLLGSLLSRLPGGGAKHHEPRDAIQAIANTGVAALMLTPGLSHSGLFLAYCALAAALSDTASSEIGMRYGRNPSLLLFGQTLTPGENGGMSRCGTIAGAVFALLMGFVFVCGGNSWWLGLYVATSGLLGNVADSLLGATIEQRLKHALGVKWGNDLVNFLATLVAAGFGWIALLSQGFGDW